MVQGGSTVSVIIPAYNASGTIEACIASLLAQQTEPPFEIIVVDDGSTDGTGDIAARYPGVKVLRQRNGGAAAARNIGACKATGDILCLIDADCVATSGWVESLVRVIKAGADGAKGTLLSGQKELVARFTQIEYEDRYNRMNPQRQIDFIDTGSAAYRRDVFLEAGGFDETLSENEDQELSFRLAAQGCDLRFAPEAQVYHLHPTTLRAYIHRKFDIGRWKVPVLTRHPSRAVSDSHTPPSLKAQVLLFYAMAALLILPAVQPSTWWLRRLRWLAAIFVATGSPFIAKAARKDPPVALVSPLLLLVRAASLGTGLLYGAVILVRTKLYRFKTLEREL